MQHLHEQITWFDCLDDQLLAKPTLWSSWIFLSYQKYWKFFLSEESFAQIEISHIGMTSKKIFSLVLISVIANRKFRVPCLQSTITNGKKKDSHCSSANQAACVKCGDLLFQSKIVCPCWNDWLLLLFASAFKV